MAATVDQNVGNVDKQERGLASGDHQDHPKQANEDGDDATHQAVAQTIQLIADHSSQSGSASEAPLEACQHDEPRCDQTYGGDDVNQRAEGLVARPVAHIG